MTRVMTGFITCGPNEALVVSGCGHRKPSVVAGGRVFVWPVLQRVQRLSLNAMSVTVVSSRVYTRQAIPLTVTSLAIVQIDAHKPDLLSAACRQLLGKTADEVIHIARETIDGHQRAVMSATTVEQIMTNGVEFADKVRSVAAIDLSHMGLTVIAYTVQDVSDGGVGYIKALGMTPTARVKCDARIGEAETTKDTVIGRALAVQQLLTAQYANQAAIERSRTAFEVTKAEFDSQVLAMKAVADLSYRLQAAKTGQLIKAEQMEVKVIEKLQEVRLMELEVDRKQRQLVSTVGRVADADKYALERLSEAYRKARVMDAESQAIDILLRADAEAANIVAKAKAESRVLAMSADSTANLMIFASISIKDDNLYVFIFIMYCISIVYICCFN